MLPKYKLKQYQRIMHRKTKIFLFDKHYCAGNFDLAEELLQRSWQDISDIFWMRETDFLKLTRFSADLDKIMEGK